VQLVNYYFCDFHKVPRKLSTYFLHIFAVRTCFVTKLERAKALQNAVTQQNPDAALVIISLLHELSLENFGLSFAVCCSSYVAKSVSIDQIYNFRTLGDVDKI
jgi:hypothetical protein